MVVSAIFLVQATFYAFSARLRKLWPVAMSFPSKPLSGKFGQLLDRVFGVPGVFREYPGRFVMTQHFANLAQRIRDLQVLEDDVWVVSYPRTGSTWCQELVWLIGNDLDYEGAKNKIQHFRAPILEFSSVLITEEYSGFMKEYGDSVDLVKNQSSPRFIKSHLPVHLLPIELFQVKPKVIYVARNPKDIVVSYYHYLQLVHHFTATFEEFAELFLNDMVPFGSIWSHYLGFWQIRNEPNVLFVKYEDMKKDLRAIVLKVADFLQKKLTEDQIEGLLQYLDFENMRNNRSVNIKPILEKRIHGSKEQVEFIRNGVVGDWKNYMTDELSERFDRWIHENTKETGLNFF